MLGIAIMCIVAGALEIAGASAEVVVGLQDRAAWPLLGGTLGLVAGAMILGAGIGLLRAAPRAPVYVRAAALTAPPILLFIGVVRPMAGGLAILLGTVVPLVAWWFAGREREGRVVV